MQQSTNNSKLRQISKTIRRILAMRKIANMTGEAASRPYEDLLIVGIRVRFMPGSLWNNDSEETVIKTLNVSLERCLHTVKI